MLSLSCKEDTGLHGSLSSHLCNSLLKRRLDVPNLLSMLDLPDTVKLEEEQPVDPSDDVATEPVQAELADLPFLKRRLDVPDLLSMLDLPKTDLPNILALTPMPRPLELPVEIPAGEARGRFTIAPESNLDTFETEPGSPSAVVPGDQGVGLAGENALSTSVVNITFGPGVGAKGKGSSSGGGGDVGPGSGTGSGSGSGAGSGAGPGPFAGITIVGGVGGTGTSGSGTGSGSGLAPSPSQLGSDGDLSQILRPGGEQARRPILVNLNEASSKPSSCRLELSPQSRI